MRILMVCSEYAPIAKVGGLADVTAGLGEWLARNGHEVAIVMPFYRGMKDPKPELSEKPLLGPKPVPGDESSNYAVYRLNTDGHGDRPAIYLVDAPSRFGGSVYSSGEHEALRFLLLSRAALELAVAIDFRPDILHCHDWHAAPAAIMLRATMGHEPTFRRTYIALTIHNIGYQGVFAAEVLQKASESALLPVMTADSEDPAQINFLRSGILHADVLTTVSPTHAQEIQTAEYGMGLDAILRQRRHRLVGILNGVDYSRWDPSSDPLLPASFSTLDPGGKRLCREALAAQAGLRLEEGVPVVGMVTRLAQQKGIDIVIHALPGLLEERRFACVFLGTGEARYAAALRGLAERFPGRVAFLEVHDERLAHLIYAGSDLFLVPSLYEPCGLTQMYAMRYGTVPVVRRTGGLADTVTHFDPATGTGTGSVFLDADVGGLSWALRTALDWYSVPAQWTCIVTNGMRTDWSWDNQGPRYEALFARLVRNGES